MTRPIVIWVLAGTWLIAFAGAFIAFSLTEPTGDGFTRGLNRTSAFFGWQIAALLIAIVSAVAGRGVNRQASPWLRRLGFAPLILSGALLVGIVILVATLMVAGQ